MNILPVKKNGGYTITLIVTSFNMKNLLSGADPGFVVRGGVSMRGVWGPRLRSPVGQGQSRGSGPRGAKPPPPPPRKLWGFEKLDIYLNDNFEPTTPFLSNQKNLTLSLNFVG